MQHSWWHPGSVAGAPSGKVYACPVKGRQQLEELVLAQLGRPLVLKFNLLRRGGRQERGACCKTRESTTHALGSSLVDRLPSNPISCAEDKRGLQVITHATKGTKVGKLNGHVLFEPGCETHDEAASLLCRCARHQRRGGCAGAVGGQSLSSPAMPHESWALPYSDLLHYNQSHNTHHPPNQQPNPYAVPCATLDAAR